ncbi:MAG: SRPBCC domain-containing protein [Acidobacteria bacterium]|nr:SRPBCC domain-containing protein [Acidobacteriota bacterium]
MNLLAGPWPSTTLALSRWYKASIDEVFEAFTNPELLRQWWGPRNFTIEDLSFPAVEGGEYRVRLRAPDGSTYAHSGTFQEVRRPDRLCYSWRWTEGPFPDDDTLVELDFHAEDGGTRVELVHSRFPDRATRDAHGGWVDSLERLTTWLARGPGPG